MKCAWKQIALFINFFPHAIAIGESICALEPSSYQQARMQYPAFTAALEYISDSIMTWYTDRGDHHEEIAQSLVESCDENSRIGVVVYGLPNKDCAAGYSSSGGNMNADDYAAFLDTLVHAIGDRKVLYILEPDAISLTVNGGCGTRYNYVQYLKLAVQKLSMNPNAYIYADVGHWSLQSTSSCAGVAEIVRDLATIAPLKGVALNTANYRKNEELAALCAALQAHIGDEAMHCLIDTSRNYNGPADDNEWCNNKLAGIGHPPTSETGVDNIDYFLYVKVPGESDGLCNSIEQGIHSMPGPSGGSFFPEFFEALWNQGYFVHEWNTETISVNGVPVAPVPITPVVVTPPSIVVPNVSNVNVTIPLPMPSINVTVPNEQTFSQNDAEDSSDSFSGSYSDASYGSASETDGDTAYVDSVDPVYCQPGHEPVTNGSTVSSMNVSITDVRSNVSAQTPNKSKRVIIRRPSNAYSHSKEYSKSISFAAEGNAQRKKLPAMLAIAGTIAAVCAVLGVAFRVYRRRNPSAHGVNSPSGHSRSLAATPIDHSAL